MKIKSKIDVITNSSTEVFIFKISSQEYKELPNNVKEEFLEFNTLQDIRNIVDDENYYGKIIPEEYQSLYGEIPDYLDPYSSEHRDILNGLGLSKDELWELFGKEYSGLVGYAIFSRDTYDGDSNISEAIYYTLGSIRERKVKEKLDQYPVGTILAIPLGEDIFKVGKDFPILVKYCDNYTFEGPYCRSWKKLENNLNFNQDEIKKHFKGGFLISNENLNFLYMCDILNLREATEDEKNEYKKQSEYYY